jgi:hypothetical protein
VAKFRMMKLTDCQQMLGEGIQFNTPAVTFSHDPFFAARVVFAFSPLPRVCAAEQNPPKPACPLGSDERSEFKRKAWLSTYRAS